MPRHCDSEAPVPPELLTGFVVEAQDYLSAISGELAVFRDQVPSQEGLQRLRRSVHTLKSAAGVVGIRPVVQLTHHMEDLVAALSASRLPVHPRVHDLLLATWDTLDDLVHNRKTAAAVTTTMQTLQQAYIRILGDTPPAVRPSAALDGCLSEETGLAPQTETPGVRVPTARLDELVHLAHDLLLSSATYEQQVARLARQVEALTTAPCDLRALAQDFTDTLRHFESYRTRQTRLTHDLEDKLLHLRLAPLASLSTRLQQAVRVTAREQGKRVTLHIEGDDVAFDKTVLETVAVPLLHVMRNAVAHGIEPPAQRQALGKAPQGQIYLRAFTTGMQMVIEVSDDGAGLDPQQLRAAAVCGGFMSEAAVAALSDTHLYQLIFLPGFSTAPGLSEVSGRGIGLDVVNATVKRLKGHVALIASRHQGLTFSIRLPMTLTLTRVLLVQVYDATFALPLADVIQLLPLEATAIVYSGDTACIQVAGQDVAVIWLGEHLQVAPRTASPAGRLAAVLLQAGTQQVACVVDHFLGAREVITKSLGNHLRRLPSVIGCTVLDAGQVVLILNPMALAPTTRPESTTC